MSKQLRMPTSPGGWGHIREADNDSEDINGWDPTEFRNFIKWFMEVNYPEAVKQYQAIRDIERQAERAAQIEADIRMAELAKQYWAKTSKSVIPQIPPKKSFWERCKELAKRPLSHGDYY